MSTTVAEIIRQKDQHAEEVLSVDVHATIAEAAAMMAAHRIGCLVVSEGGTPVGLLGERDIVVRFAGDGGCAGEVHVGGVCQREFPRLAINDEVGHCMRMMTSRRNRHLPVYDGDRLVGVISIGDVVKAIIDDQRFTIDQLATFITGVQGSGD
ncbi:MAG: CBS domain-containing protein [Planctomycetota bacterium]|jgi:CBS domain-containing protein